MTGTCGKCNGAGKLTAFSHIHNGTCFWCGGTGKLTVPAEKADRTRVPRPLPSRTIELPSIRAKVQLVKVTADTLQATVWTPGADYDDPNAIGGQFYVDLRAAKRGEVVARGFSCGVSAVRAQILADLRGALKAL